MADAHDFDFEFGTWSYDGANTIRFEQAFSVDEGATWETNL